jgi:predicted  nucleic acid-binding Zn-ribbon protein
MQHDMRQLIVLRDIDAEITVVDAELAKLPGERTAIERLLVEARARVAKCRDVLEQEEIEERRFEAQMRDQEALLAKLNDQMSQVTTTQAYEAMQHEIDHAREAGSDSESRALEMMEAIDTARTELAEAESELGGLESAAPGQLEVIDAREQKQGAEKVDRLERRAKESGGMDAKILARYEAFPVARRPAVGIIDGRVCPECRIKLPTQVVMEMRRLDAVHACTSCRRLLVPEVVMTE